MRLFFVVVARIGVLAMGVGVGTTFATGHLLVAGGLLAAYVFGTLGLGITFPDSAMAQFNAGQPWTVVPGSTVEGGHYVPYLARRGAMSVVATWAKEQYVDDHFTVTNNDENVVYLSAEFLAGGKSLEGFDLDQLNADLATLPPAT